MNILEKCMYIEDVLSVSMYNRAVNKIRELGRGSFGVVYEVEDKKTHIRRALKCIPDTGKMNMSELEADMGINKNLKSPYLVQIVHRDCES
jgi:serine/threonine protein kinase